MSSEVRFETGRNRFCNFRAEKGASLDCMHVDVPERGRYLYVNGSERNRTSKRKTSLLLDEVWGHNMSLYAHRILCCNRSHNTGAMAPMRRECFEVCLLDDNDEW